MSRLVLEVGCENLPPASIRSAFEQLKKAAAAKLEELRLPFDRIYATGTPRRLVLIVEGLAGRQTSRTETITGPPVSKAFDEAGDPTRAAEGFAKSHGMTVAKMGTVKTERGDYLGFTRKMKIQSTAVLLKEVLPELIAGLRFPKMMKWEETEFRFARPIRWIVALLDDKIVRFMVAGVKSAGTTRTVPWIHRQKHAVGDAASYEDILDKTGLILDHDARKEAIARLANEAAQKEGLTLVEDPALLDELTFMLEVPDPLLGQFDDKYLMLPPEVVITAMKAHQRYLAFRDGHGNLVPRFLTFTEGRVGSPSTVRLGNEKVLKARLEDALFYWHEDLKTGMDGLVQKLESIVFIEGLGSLKDKTQRVCDLAMAIRDQSGAAVSDDSIRRAALLAKSDLASEMIKDGKEFTLLQGLIGSYYANESGEPEDVAVAIREHYQPRSPGDAMPASRLGALLSMADRLDTLAGCFIAGFVPSGSQDPYALRRQANGMLRILEADSAVSLAPLLEQAVAGYGRAGLVDDARGAEVLGQLVEFIKTRTARFLEDKEIPYDAVAAVSAVAWAKPAVALGRARAIQALRGDGAFELLITGAKRVGNILDDDLKRFGCDWEPLREAFLGSGRFEGEIGFDKDSFVDDAETELYKAISETLSDLARHEADEDGEAALRALSALGPAIDRYFDDVMVNAPEEVLRSNRHQFLAAVFALFSKYADFSYIVEEGAGSPSEPQKAS
jgi:glycyl-tRNA synthetase beta chain